MIARTSCAALALLATLCVVTAVRADPGDELTVTVLTFGPGDEAFDKFGHDAIWIHDASAEGEDQDWIYNYGTFSFTREKVLTFFAGRFTYWLSRSRLYSIRSYQRENRMIDAQELRLTAAQKKALYEKLEWNRRPENKHYKYDYYRDNCATRVRDLLDEATGGRLRAVTSGPGAMTYRQHTLRLTADYLAEYVLLDLVMGDLIDRPTTEWDEAFLPGKLQEQLRRVTVPGPDGDVPLVVSEKRMFEARRAPPLEQPPERGKWMALLGAAFGGALGGLGLLGTKHRGARIGFGALLSIVGLVLGFFGCFFLLAWALTDHEVGYRNQNVFLCAPWALWLVGAGIGVARGLERSTRRARAVALAGLAFVAIGVFVRLLPYHRQDNIRFVALLVPVWVGVVAGLEALYRSVSAEGRARARVTAGP